MTNLQKKYIDLLGFVPETIKERDAMAKITNSKKTIQVVESLREELILNNLLDPKTQQLVHFALLIGSMQEKPALLHAIGALKAGATKEELFGVCQTATITGGMPAFSLAIKCMYKAINNK